MLGAVLLFAKDGTLRVWRARTRVYDCYRM